LGYLCLQGLGSLTLTQIEGSAGLIYVDSLSIGMSYSFVTAGLNQIEGSVGHHWKFMADLDPKPEFDLTASNPLE
jgi:hypothetical protein